MSGPGDISDEFDDDALRDSIERAESAGQWRDSASGFVDPKLAAIEKQLAEPSQAASDYAERRRRELQQRAALQIVDEAPEAKPKQKKLQDPFAGDWREAVANKTTAAAAEDAAPAAEGPPAPVPAGPSYVGSRRSSHPVLTTIRPLVTGFGVFATVATAQVLLAGWHYDIALRTGLAALVAGFLWQKLDAERFRAAVIGTTVHLVTFFVTSLHWDVRTVIANCTGFLIALIGSLVVGSLTESRGYLADRP